MTRTKAAAAQGVDRAPGCATAGGVWAEGIHKRFGDQVALAGVDLVVPAGCVVALLGQNGAGKTTLVRTLATLARPDAGRARVAGWDVCSQSARVRAAVALTGQYVAVDEDLTGRENLHLVGRLAHLRRAEVRARAGELLGRLGLDDAADRRVGGYSGGMRRRLDLASSLMTDPQVLFLDEPTTGLDPSSRLALWELIDQLREQGTTILLTTQYLEEAERLADRVCVLDHGRVIADGPTRELKAAHGDEVIELTLSRPTDTTRAFRAVVGSLGVGHERARLQPETATIVLPAEAGVASLLQALSVLQADAIPVLAASVRQPTLEEVFLRLTDLVLRDRRELGRQPGEGHGSAL